MRTTQQFKRAMNHSSNNSKYQWPANQLTEKEMAILHRWRELTKTPINHLLKQAIEELNQIIERR